MVMERWNNFKGKKIYVEVDKGRRKYSGTDTIIDSVRYPKTFICFLDRFKKQIVIDVEDISLIQEEQDVNFQSN